MKNSIQNYIRCGLAVLTTGAFFCGSLAVAAEKDAKKAGNPQLSWKDKSFMKEAAKGGKEEVQMGQMAEQKGSSSEVKEFGKMMVADHSKANDELMALAEKKGVKLDVNPKPGKMGGSNFDREYINGMVKDHEKDVAAFEKEAKNGSDPDVKEWANQTLPTLRRHLERAKEIQSMLEKKS